MLEQGAAWNDQIVFTQFDQVTPINLTGYNASLRVRATPQSSIVCDFNSVNGKISIPTPSNGIMVMAPTATDMEGLAPGVYMYELCLYDGATPPNVIPLMGGTFTVMAALNKPWSST